MSVPYGFADRAAQAGREVGVEEAEEAGLAEARPEDLALLIYATGDEESRKAVTAYIRTGDSPFEGMDEEEVKDYDRKLAQQIVLAAT